MLLLEHLKWKIYDFFCLKEKKCLPVACTEHLQRHDAVALATYVVCTEAIKQNTLWGDERTKEMSMGKGVRG